MRTSILSLALLVGSVTANAAVVCYGIQDNKGIRADFIQTAENDFTITYTDKEGRHRSCEFSKDTDYKPRTPDPRSDRYYPDSDPRCGAELAMVSKALFKQEAKGYVDVEFPCWGGGGCAHNEPGPIDSFFCDLRR